jgi:hypothetical protein
MYDVHFWQEDVFPPANGALCTPKHNGKSATGRTYALLKLLNYTQIASVY